MSPSKVPEGQSRGFIVPIGGAEDKIGDEDILKRFVGLCGGRRARIAVIPTASELRDTGRRYEKLFDSLRASDVKVLPFLTRRDCEDADSIETLERAHGVFLTGGNQLRLSTTLGGTPIAKSLRLMNARGVHVAGTSAGAAFLSEHMIASGEEGATPRAGMVSLAPGLGLTNRVVVDQHFRQRDRIGRLLASLAYNPFAVGVGLDEDTAAFIGPDETLEVVGSGAVTIVDPAKLEYSSMDAAKRGDPVCLLGITLHVLIAGATFNLHTRVASAGELGRH
ncbi:MAG: cyanophycinase [Candidatus Eisenbacteria bacterium]|uniref:Cyanophycinase n=1 Tax=Eiseniibacteriota bacterium TaxID=2212470 RepID=A0A849SSY0_UNCEI|nr:cyanophycinase [Candidatus Eisenbacteria bacterium]